MVWWIGGITAGIAALRFFGSGLTPLAWISVVVAIGGFWTAGIAANLGKDGNLINLSDGVTGINAIAAVSGITLLIASAM